MFFVLGGENNRYRDELPKSAWLVGIRAILLVVNLDYSGLSSKFKTVARDDD